jgi:tRNA(Ile)-lysidine synthase
VTSFVERVAETISSRALLAGGRSVLVAASGGPDSTALLLAMMELAPRFGVTLGVCAVDHGRRPAAREETAFVASLAEAHGLPFVIECLDPPPRGHDQARTMRYEALERARAALGLDLLATGHTRTDQAETVLMRILRGTGLAGLGAIPARRGSIIRPLLDVSRNDVLSFLSVRGQRHVEDPSNADPRTLRARVRHEIVPVLLRESAGLERTLAALADEVRALGPAVERDPRADGAHALREALRGAGLSAEHRHVDAILRMLGVLPRRDPRAAACEAPAKSEGRYRLPEIGADVAVPASLVPAVVRNRRPGDRLQSGERLSRRFAVARVPPRLRSFVPLVARGAVVLALPPPIGDPSGVTFSLDESAPLARWNLRQRDRLL